MVMRASDPRQAQVPHWAAMWLGLVFGLPLLLFVVWLIRIVFEFLRIVLS